MTASARTRQQRRVRFDLSLGGWVVTHYSDARRVLREGDAFSAAAYSTLQPDVSGSHLFLLADEQTRARLRRAFARAVTRTFVTDITSRILTPIARAIVERHEASACVDPVEALARPYSRAALFELTEVDREAGDGLVVALRIAHERFAAQGSKSTEGWAATAVASDLASEALSGPGVNPWSLRSRLYADRDLSSSEQIACLLPLFETLAVRADRDLPVCLLRQLAAMPGDRQQQTLEDGRLLAAAEESVRLQPGGVIPRNATRDLDIGGAHVKAGELVFISLSEANTDPEQFGCPHEFDPNRRDLGRHHGFGGGGRVCVGRRLATALACCLAEQTLRKWRLSTLPDSTVLAMSPRQPSAAEVGTC
jgi:cytochrome P450